jgi:hypothetical protein
VAGAQRLLKNFGPPGKIHSIKISAAAPPPPPPPPTKTPDYTSEVNNKYLAIVVDKLGRENPSIFSIYCIYKEQISYFKSDILKLPPARQRAIPFNIHTPLLTKFSKGGLKF